MNTVNAHHRQTILIVDDTPENITVLGELLQPYYAIKVVTSGPRAIQSALNLPRPDLILLDVMMPEMDGYQVLRKLRETAETKDIPVIFVTALDAPDDETFGLELGAADYITKPIRPAVVLARVRSQLELKHARDRLSNQNAWLEQEIARRMRENQLIQDAAIRALASLAETRDNETGNHILRTQGYVECLCNEIMRTQPTGQTRLSKPCCDLITKAAPLHDIGKVGIPDQILLKPGKLGPEEWVVMQTHTTLGADAILRAIHDHMEQPAFECLKIAAIIARSHHEKWDGTGYPDGLAGEAIPLPARLMALADVFDALISRRSYKDAMSMASASAIIVEGRGTHFDPAIVDAFMRCQDDFAAIAQRYADNNVD